MNEMVDCVSFGAGVQSTAIMVLAGEGHIPMPQHWVFSDPGFETSDGCGSLFGDHFEDGMCGT
jgi:hypothetical protein